MESDALLRRILAETRVIACVGWSPNPARPSHGVARDLVRRGYRVIPVTPGHAGRTFFGECIVADLADLSAPVDMVDVFRRSEAVPLLVETALSRLPGLRTLWLQLGVRHPVAESRAEAAGIAVIRGRCPKIELQRLFGPSGPGDAPPVPVGA